MAVPSEPPSAQVNPEFFGWLGVLAAIVVIGAIVLAWIRRRMRRDNAPVEGFTLHDLRQMHERGELDDAEYARAKESLLQLVQRTPSENPDASTPHDPND